MSKIIYNGKEYSNTDIKIPDLAPVISDAYSNQKVYHIGDYTINDNVLYKCIIDVNKEDFSLNKWKATTISNELYNLIQSAALAEDVNNLENQINDIKLTTATLEHLKEIKEQIKDLATIANLNELTETVINLSTQIDELQNLSKSISQIQSQLGGLSLVQTTEEDYDENEVQENTIYFIKE